MGAVFPEIVVMIASVPFVSPAQQLHSQFLTILPLIERHARIRHRGVRCPDQRADRVAETVALAWRWFVRLAMKGKDATRWPTVLADYAVKAVRSGRRLCGTVKSKDALNEQAQRRYGFVVEPLPSWGGQSFDRRGARHHQDEWERALRGSTVTPVDEAVAFKLDFRAWLRTRTPRERRVIRRLMRNERTRDVAQAFGVSAGRVSQLRREFQTGWQCFVGDEPVCGRRRLRRQKRAQPVVV